MNDQPQKEKEKVTGPNAREWNGVLADKVVADKLVIQNNETDERHFRMVNIKLETFFEDGTIPFVRNRPRLSLCNDKEIKTT
jgi:hypothetical protein